MKGLLLGIGLLVVLHYGIGCGENDHGPTTPPADTPSVEAEVRAAFVDTALAEAVLAALSQTSLSLDSLTTLSARGRGIAALTGIELLASLRSLDLAGNQIRDLSPLANLDSLVFLDLANNRIEDLATLAGLDRLEILILDLNPVRDLAPLLGLPGLTSLELLGCPLENADAQLIQLIARGVSVTRTDGGGGSTLSHGSLVFASDRGGDFDLYAVDLDGANLVNLTRHPAGDYLPRWSPDASRIAFVSDREGDTDIFLMDAAGTGLTNLTRHQGRDLGPTWSPDGTRLAFASDREGDYDIYLVEAIGGEPVNLTRSPAMDFSPGWSPDGTRIAYASADQGSAHEIWVVEISGGNPVRLTDNPASDLNPVWSPDGSRIAFMSDRDQASGSYDLWLMSSDGTGQVNLTRRAGDLVVSNNTDPTWSPDGAFLAFASSRQGNLDICLVSAGGGEVTVLTTSPATDYQPSWSPRSVLEYVTEIPPEPEVPTPPDSSALPVVFADPRLEVVVRSALPAAGGTLTRGDVQAVE
ncbi:MAG: leucine-rich repeat domain-containing protein, partial [Candidatus Latescibacterota bacterium]